MITEEQKKKIERACQFVAERSPTHREIICIVTTNESVGDVYAGIPTKDKTTLYDLSLERAGEEVARKIAHSLTAGNTVVLSLCDYLDPFLYNQLTLFVKEGKFSFGEEIFSSFPSSAGILFIISESNSEKLNYQNLFDLCGIVVRL